MEEERRGIVADNVIFRLIDGRRAKVALRHFKLPALSGEGGGRHRVYTVIRSSIRLIRLLVGYFFSGAVVAKPNGLGINVS